MNAPAWMQLPPTWRSCCCSPGRWPGPWTPSLQAASSGAGAWKRRCTAWPASMPNESRAGCAYGVGLLVFNGLGVLAVYALQRLQPLLPLNPQAMAAVSPDSAFNTAISFVTNTNWQGYGGESTMSYLTQMLGLTVQNFLSAATGIVVVVVADPRLRAPLGAGGGQRLGGPDARHALDPAAAVVRVRAGAGRPGRHPEPQAVPGGADPGVRHLAATQARRGRPGREGRPRASR